MTVTVKQLVTRNLTLKLLCLAVAVSVWCLASTSRRARFDLSLPLTVADIPTGYVVTPSVPATVTFTVAGPSILINGTRRANTEVRLSLAGAVKPGRTVFMHLETHLKLPEGVTVIRISPAALELNLEPGYSPTGGQHP